ncbi:(2Fe-2S)-binding protein [Neobacillus drentensis]|jgi:NAD(P)H-nitrite reductase large subunit|uniref:(2Fe-2S)-binding protein n=1 Tax=Neobacillus drentensis TaxID=220684 RepID=UPI002FFF243A
MSNLSYIVCRCEEVSMDSLQAAINDGASTLQELKMATRAGMGICQGRICRTALDCLIPNHKNGILEHPSMLTIHQPTRPVSLSQIVAREIQR